MLAIPRSLAAVYLACLTLSLSGTIHAQYGYGPSPELANSFAPEWTNSSPATQPVETLASQSGFLHVRDGVFIQLEGTTLSLGDIPAEAGDAATFLSADTAYGFMGTVGSIGHRGVGFEVAAGYYNTTYSGSFRGVQGVDADVDAKLTIIPAFVNLRFQLGITRSLGIELGAGAGGAYTNASATALTDFGDFSAEESAWAAGYQGMIGLSYALGNHADITLHYRHMAFPTGDSLKANSLGLGLRFRF